MSASPMPGMRVDEDGFRLGLVDRDVPRVRYGEQGRDVWKRELVRRRARIVNGAGDAIAALFFGHFLERGSAGEAMAAAVSSMFGVLNRTLEAGAREILLVEAQDELLRPTTTFKAERL